MLVDDVSMEEFDEMRKEKRNAGAEASDSSKTDSQRADRIAAKPVATSGASTERGAEKPSPPTDTERKNIIRDIDETGHVASVGVSLEPVAPATNPDDIRQGQAPPGSSIHDPVAELLEPGPQPSRVLGPASLELESDLDLVEGEVG